jgi:hypothetical protein
MYRDMIKSAGLVGLLTMTALFVPSDAGAELPSRNVLFTTGFDYSSGDYGTDQTTDMLFIPFTAKYATDQWSMSLTLPWLSIDSDGDFVVGPDGRPIPVPGGEPTSESGLGDITAAYTWFAYPGTDTYPIVDVTGRVKFPTADEDKGLGTGEMDFALETDLIKGIDRHSLFVTLGYKIFGDKPDFEIDNVFYTSIGDSYRYSPATSFGAFFDARQATTEFNDGISELTGFVSHRLAPKWKLMSYLVAGFSDASPDWGVGVMVTRDTGFDELGRILPSQWRNVFQF